jgi:hypothetical protein
MLGRGFVPQVPAANNGSAIQEKATLPLTWNGTMMDAADTETYHLHLSAFLCEKCNGPIITGSLGTRHDQISKETDIRSIGAVCIVCGFMPKFMVEPAPEHRFRPVEWKWTIKDQTQPACSGSPAVPAELPEEKKP